MYPIPPNMLMPGQNQAQAQPQTQPQAMGMMPNQQAPQMPPSPRQAMTPQMGGNPMQRGSPQGVNGGTQSLFKNWQKDENGDYKDLNGNDVTMMLKSLNQNPQAVMGIGKAMQAHIGSGYKSSGDFRKDATMGMAQLMSLLSDKGGS